MKRTLFSALSALCLGAMILFAMSCDDDSKIWNEIGNLDDRLTTVEEKLKALETSLNENVATLNGKITALETAYKEVDEERLASISALTTELDALDGKVDGFVTSSEKALTDAIEELKAADEKLAATDTEVLAALVKIGVTNVAKNEAGNVVLTFTDGETLEVPTEPQEGLVTVVEVEGQKYWAVVTDGEPVSLGVPVGHVDLRFQVNPETYSLEYSVDGGTTWKATGAYVVDSQDNLITDFYQYKGFNYDIFEWEEDDFYTLVFGGVKYYLPLYKADNSVATIKAGKTFFSYEEVKSIAIALTDISNLYVMTKPDGWKAKLNGKTLTVTAPAKAAIEAGYAEEDGEVLLHGTTAAGTCKIARLIVSTTSGLTLKVEDDKVTIVNPYIKTVTNFFGDVTEFAEVMVGLATIADFESDPLAYLASVENNTCYDPSLYLSNYKSNTIDKETGKYTVGGAYVKGEYEVDNVVTTVPELWAAAKFVDMPKGTHVIVWTVPLDAETGKMRKDELVFDYYMPIEVKLTAAETKSDDITLNASLYGGEKFLVGKVSADIVESYGMSIAQYLQTQHEGPFWYFLYYGSMEEYTEYAEGRMGISVEPGESTITLSKVVYMYEDVAALTPNIKYYVWAMPIIAGKDYADYTYEADLAPYIYEFTTAASTDDASGADAVTD